MIASEPSSGSLIFNDTATTEIYTLSLHDALPILGLAACPDVVIAMTELADRLEIVAAERVRVELEKLLLGRWPRQGLELLVETGVAGVFLPELPALQMLVDEHHRHKDVYEYTLTVLEQAIDLEDGPGGAVP